MCKYTYVYTYIPVLLHFLCQTECIVLFCYQCVNVIEGGMQGYDEEGGAQHPEHSRPRARHIVYGH